MTRSFDVFFDLHLNKRLSKQSWCWWFETLSRLIWRHCNEHDTFDRWPLPARHYLSIFKIRGTTKLAESISSELIRWNTTIKRRSSADDTHLKWQDDARCPNISCWGTILPLSYLCGRGYLPNWSLHEPDCFKVSSAILSSADSSHSRKVLHFLSVWCRLGRCDWGRTCYFIPYAWKIGPCWQDTLDMICNI